MTDSWIMRLGVKLFGSGEQVAAFINTFLPYEYEDNSGKSVRFERSVDAPDGIVVRIAEATGGITEITVPDSEFQRIIDEHS